MLKAVTVQGGSPTIYTTTYSQFKGVDFSTDAMLVDKGRSPYALNLISDSGSMPEKRPGWRTLHDLEGAINGLWHCHIDGNDHYLVHAGSKIYRWTDDPNVAPTVLKDGVNDDRSCAFFLLSKLYILTGTEYLQFDGETIKEVEAYVPTVTINRKPKGNGGEHLQAFNLIGSKWTEEFIGDGESTEYQLSYTELDEEAEVLCKIYETDKWVDKKQGTDLTAEGTDFVVNPTTGKVTFKAAPAKATISNVKITASKTKAENKAKIANGKNAAIYNDGVVFVCGAERGVDYRSGYGEPNYFPDTGYDNIGTNATDIMGYCKIGEYLGIIKESNNQDSTIFLRWHEYKTDENGDEVAIYRKKQGVVGVGAISRHAIGMLRDEPLFLSEQGVFALTSNAVTFERTAQNRSEFLDYKLTREPGLENAVCCEWQGYFVVAVNDHAYILDSKQQTSKSRSASNFVYEGYYWENIPARCFLSIGGSLYFGTVDGRICKFNTDVEGVSKYNDDGAAIDAVWSTISDDDGQPTRLKTMLKKGCAVTLKPFTESSAKIYTRTEQEAGDQLAKYALLREESVGIFGWETIDDFTPFTFSSNDAPQDIMIRKKIRKYKRLQFVVRNDAVNEGFGVFQITKSYTVLGLAKK